MKKLNNCVVENCIPTPSSCVEWNCGDIEFLGICNGDSLCNVIVEIISKLEDIAGEDISSFDIDEMLTICNQKAPLEVTLTSILTLLKNNDVCLKDYIDTLNEKIQELAIVRGVDVNLKCYADFDNLGNALQVTRAQLDQLVIDKLCNHEGRIESVEGSIVGLQNQINEINLNTTVEELNFGTCIDPTIKPTSSQVISTANEVCDIETAIGTPLDVAVALAKTPTDLNAEFGLLTGWILIPANWSENYGNLLIEVENLRQRLKFMEDNCCAVTCDDVKVGFSAVMNEDMTGVILRFTNGAGTTIPPGFTDSGSTVEITDTDGNTVQGSITISNNAEEEVDITGLNLGGDLFVNVTVKMTNGIVMCEKCVSKIVKLPGCSFCVITATAPVTIIYKTCTTT